MFFKGIFDRQEKHITNDKKCMEKKIMTNKVTIIGAGSVGATIAYTLVANGPVSEIVLIDINQDKANAEAIDIFQATPFLTSAKIYAGTYEDAAGSDIVIITSGVGRKPGQSRIDLTQINVNILNSKRI